MWSFAKSWNLKRVAVGLGLVAVVAATVTTALLAPHDNRFADGPTAARVAPPVSPASAFVPDAPQTFEPLTTAQAVAENASTPFSTAPNPPAAPFVLETADATDRLHAQTCLAMAVYYEAANQGPDGEAAVAQVVLNRVRSGQFPHTVCGVVFQGVELPTGCQFSFTCDGSLIHSPEPAKWKEATEVARRALNGYVDKGVGLATHYHVVWVVPYWQASVVKVAQVGAHVFYRLDGSLGVPEAFAAQYAGGETIGSPSALDANASQQLAEQAMSDAPQPPAPEPVVAPVAAPLAAQAAPTPRPVEVAMQSEQDPIVAAPTPPPPAKAKYVAHGTTSAQRLAMPSDW